MDGNLLFFDESNRVRLMPVEQARTIANLQTECSDFSSSIYLYIYILLIN